MMGLLPGAKMKYLKELIRPSLAAQFVMMQYLLDLGQLLI